MVRVLFRGGGGGGGDGCRISIHVCHLHNKALEITARPDLQAFSFVSLSASLPTLSQTHARYGCSGEVSSSIRLQMRLRDPPTIQHPALRIASWIWIDSEAY